MNRFLAALAAGALLIGATEAIAETPPAASAAPAGERLLQTSIEINAPVSEVWKAFTDPADYRRWADGVAAVDLRVGGSFEASYDPAGKIGDPDNIRHRIVAFTPERLIVFQNLQAPGLPGEALYRGTDIVLQYEPLGPNRTRVTVSHVGFGAGADYDGLYAFFKGGDARMLRAMKAAYEQPAK
jgi:uncharacterized protein YndB with AHSA1/START domain